MRCALILFVACGNAANVASDSGPTDSRPSCGTTAPPPAASCVDHGLVAADLAGTWTFTGTETIDRSSCSNQPTENSTGPKTFTVAFAVTGCAVQGNFPGQGFSGQLDDTTVQLTSVFNGGQYGSHGQQFVCADANGTLQFISYVNWYNCAQNGDQGSIRDTGTLQR